jgi:putative transposase
MMTKIGHGGDRFPFEMIQPAIWPFVRSTLSFRGFEDLLAERGITVSYETVRRWVNHFGPMIAADLRKRRPKPHTIWHLDGVYLKIDGRMVYLWRGAWVGVYAGRLRSSAQIAASLRPSPSTITAGLILA